VPGRQSGLPCDVCEGEAVMFLVLGVPLREAMATALLLNAISLAFASVVFIQGGLVRFRAALPIVITAVILSPVWAWTCRGRNDE
jgi:uncharacterized membrane protein YfcA